MTAKDISAATPLDSEANELWALMTSNQRYLNSLDKQIRLRKLRPELASFFVAKFRASKKEDLAFQASLEMAMSCGGPEAVKLFEDLLARRADPEFSIPFKLSIGVLNSGNLAPRPREFPVTSSLLEQVTGLLTSVDSVDRAASIAVLSHVDPAYSLPLLLNVVRNDSEVGIRMSAIRHVGRLGDSSTLDYLRQARSSLAREMARLSKPIQNPDGTSTVIPRSQFERVINEAIEELEERLSPK